MATSRTEDVVCFGPFELDLKAGQLRKNGMKTGLPQQPVRLLMMLLEHHGEVVTREELRGRLWPADVFVDFDHGLNKSIQRLREALSDSADSPLYIETIPRTGYRFIAPIHSESQRLERKAETGIPESAGDIEKSPAISSVRADSSRMKLKTGWVALVVCAVALAAIGVWLAGRRVHAAGPIRSLAVLPLDNLSGDPGQDYFADGMTDELTTMLAKNSTLRIVSRTSVMQYEGAHRPLREIAQALGVDGIVEGSVERSSDKVHMTLQLIQAPSDTHVWAESYDRDANDLVSLPDEAAMAIAKKTNSAVLQRTTARYVSPEAHDAYLHGEYMWYGGNNEEAGKYFRKAVELQPDYAMSWVGLSQYYGGGALGGEMDPREALAPGEAAARKAVELDDSLPIAHLALCASIFFNEWDWAQADRECVRAIDLDPKYAEAYHMRARLFAAVNRHDEGIEQEKIASELAPSSDEWGLARSYLWARKYDQGIADARQRLKSSPHNVETLEILADLYRCKGIQAEAVQAREDMLSAQGDEASAITMRRAFQQGGYRAVLLLNLTHLQRQSLKRYVSPMDMALQTAQLGQRDETLSLLEEGYRQHAPLLLWVQNDPAYDFLHSDARYRAIIKGLGLPPAY